MSYLCQRCGACCQWPGQVRVSDDEIAAIARHLHMPEEGFIEKYTRLQANRSGLALTDQPGGACVFYQSGGCAIHEVKPQQCVDFPEKWNFPGFHDVCKAIRGD